LRTRSAGILDAEELTDFSASGEDDAGLYWGVDAAVVWRPCACSVGSTPGQRVLIRTATKAAVEEGIEPGGGVALLRAAKALDKLEPENEHQKVGITVTRPQSAVLSGPPDRHQCWRRWLGGCREILERATYAFGYNAQTGEYGDLTNQGVIDPTKVVRNALQGAASIAGLLITTEAMVAERPRKESAQPPMPGGGMGGMDY
jgi:chaperonin GroEL